MTGVGAKNQYNAVTDLAAPGIQAIEEEKFVALGDEMDIIIMDAAAVKNIKPLFAETPDMFDTCKVWQNGEVYLEMAYIAFPHFPDPEHLIRTLSTLLKLGGTLTVAHGMCREKIDAHHHGTASRVSNGLMPVEDLAAIFEKHLTVTTMISDDRMYQVVGEKRCGNS